MQTEFQVLMAAAISIACLHTLSGPDHYIPFIALSRSRNWSLPRTIGWTVLCGCAHVWSSVLLGLGGAAAGWSLSRIEWLEGVRGGIAGWMLLGFRDCLRNMGPVENAARLFAQAFRCQ
jgi:hypothetical protein